MRTPPKRGLKQTRKKKTKQKLNITDFAENRRKCVIFSETSEVLKKRQFS